MSTKAAVEAERSLVSTSLPDWCTSKASAVTASPPSRIREG